MARPAISGMTAFKLTWLPLAATSARSLPRPGPAFDAVGTFGANGLPSPKSFASGPGLKILARKPPPPPLGSATMRTKSAGRITASLQALAGNIAPFNSMLIGGSSRSRKFGTCPISH
ncbi:hypothetical protein D3C76_1516310 [compost metagenome]